MLPWTSKSFTLIVGCLMAPYGSCHGFIIGESTGYPSPCSPSIATNGFSNFGASGKTGCKSTLGLIGWIFPDILAFWVSLLNARPTINGALLRRASSLGAWLYSTWLLFRALCCCAISWAVGLLRWRVLPGCVMLPLLQTWMIINTTGNSHRSSTIQIGMSLKRSPILSSRAKHAKQEK